nr:Peptide (Neuropeptide F/Y-like) G protein-coupled receptor [Hymenolepis microstoma]
MIMNNTEPTLKFFLSSQFATHRYSINTATIITLYSTIAVIGFIENAIIFTALFVIGDIRHGSEANVFVGALALSDMIHCIFNVPTQLYVELAEPSDISATSCRILFASLGIPTHVSCILILLIAFDRYRSVRFPVFASSGTPSSNLTGTNSKTIRTGIAILLVIGSLIFSILAAFPVAYYTDVQEAKVRISDVENISDSNDITFELQNKESNYPKYCIEEWPSPLRRLIYSIFVAIGQFLTPLIVTLILYARIGFWLSKRRGKLYHTSCRGESNAGYIQLAARLETRTRRTHRILVGIVACFACCWTPWTLYSLYLECRAYAIKRLPMEESQLLDRVDQAVNTDANLKFMDLVLKVKKFSQIFLILFYN